MKEPELVNDETHEDLPGYGEDDGLHPAQFGKDKDIGGKTDDAQQATGPDPRGLPTHVRRGKPEVALKNRGENEQEERTAGEGRQR